MPACSAALGSARAATAYRGGCCTKVRPRRLRRFRDGAELPRVRSRPGVVVAAEPAGVVARAALRVVRDRCGCGVGSERVLCLVSRRWAWPGGARSGDDGGAVALRLRDRRALLAADRAAVR